MNNFLTISILLSIFSFSAQANWPTELRERNVKLSEKVNWDKLDQIDQRKRSIKIAVVGYGNNLADFKDFIAVNKKEIPNNGIDDDQNGYVDDYYGVNLSTKSGADINDKRNKHETHVASMVAMMVSNNAQKEHPIEIIPIKISLDEDRYDPLYMKKVADSIDYALSRGAKVINMSLGISRWNTFPFLFIDNNKEKSLAYIQNAINRAYKAGAVVVSSSSNDVTRNQTLEPDVPSDMKHVVSVTSVDFNHVIRRAHGRIIMTAFYGEDILAYEGNETFRRVTGTSFAGPMVASSIAMLMAKRPELSVREIRKKVTKASIHKIYGKRKVRSGVFDVINFLK